MASFYGAIAKADRMAVIDGGFDCYGRDTKAKPLFEVSKPDEELRRFAEILEFETGQSRAALAPATAIPASIGTRARNACGVRSRSSMARRFAGRGLSGRRQTDFDRPAAGSCNGSPITASMR